MSSKSRTQRYAETRHRSVLTVTTPIASKTFTSTWVSQKRDLRFGPRTKMIVASQNWLAELSKLVGYTVEGEGSIKTETETIHTIELMTHTYQSTSRHHITPSHLSADLSE